MPPQPHWIASQVAALMHHLCRNILQRCWIVPSFVFLVVGSPLTRTLLFSCQRSRGENLPKGVGMQTNGLPEAPVQSHRSLTLWGAVARKGNRWRKLVKGYCWFEPCMYKVVCAPQSLWIAASCSWRHGEFLFPDVTCLMACMGAV